MSGHCGTAKSMLVDHAVSSNWLFTGHISSTSHEMYWLHQIWSDGSVRSTQFVNLHGDRACFNIPIRIDLRDDHLMY